MPWASIISEDSCAESMGIPRKKFGFPSSSFLSNCFVTDAIMSIVSVIFPFIADFHKDSAKS